MRTAFLTAAAAILVAAAAGTAGAQTWPPTEQPIGKTHVLTLRLPNGQVEQVRYIGDVAPTVVLVPNTMPTAFAPASPFAMLEQMSADMDRQAAVLFQNINTLTAMNTAGFGLLPVMSGSGVCARSVQITFAGDGHAPHVVSQTSGDCGPTRGSAAPAVLPNPPAPIHGPGLVEAKADTPPPNLPHQMVAWQR